MKSKLLFYSVPDPDKMPQPTGHFQKGILIICSESDLNYDVAADLTKILSAIKIDLVKDTGLVILDPNSDIGISHYFNNHNIKSVLIFGANQKQIGLLCQAQLYQWIKYDKTNVLFAESISAVMSAKARKMKLWMALKDHFSNQ